jgi:hypothetical protein
MARYYIRFLALPPGIVADALVTFRSGAGYQRLSRDVRGIFNEVFLSTTNVPKFKIFEASDTNSIHFWP